MQLNSDSAKNQNSVKNNPSIRRFSNRKSFRSFLGYSVKPTKNVSKFYSTSLSKSKDINKNPRINLFIANINIFKQYKNYKILISLLIIIILLITLARYLLCILILSVQKRISKK